MSDLPDIHDVLSLVRYLRTAKCKECGIPAGDSGIADVTVGREGIPVKIEIICARCIDKKHEQHVLAN